MFLRMAIGTAGTEREKHKEREREKRTIHAHLALVLEIAFIGDDDDGERVLVLYSEDLLVEGRDFFKRVARGDRVDEEEAFPCTHVLLAHRTVVVIIITRRSQ